ncbi:binding-protein-dependent transport systems inner membrane component [Candidatus Moduliflexus flocculans]|uniref:Binding-protein-dependent transport systems inner membrane component n=1 Tax=Candidatus Moduliflexus flocculans TaxID=1499966 RepID=A0A081BN79_9BACT|nr:binding-protein-dependent transport systems inner membrane component [Candidatus Moduliflexus flocculans]
MRWADLLADVRSFWDEFRREKSGLFSLFLLALFFALMLTERLIIPFPEARSRWRDIAYWENNPRSAPPVWVNWFAPVKRARSAALHSPEITEKQAGKVMVKKAVFVYEYDADAPPTDILFTAQASGSPVFVMSVERPDGETLKLFKKSFSKLENKPVRLAVENEAKGEAAQFAARRDPETQNMNKDLLSPTAILFAKAQTGMLRHPEPLRGTYRFTVEMLLPDNSAKIDAPALSFAGGVAGWLGTDSSRRDLWSGVIAGMRWALLIGLLTAAVAVSLGVVFGVASAYFGGWVDALMQRVFELFVSIPLLPLLIVMSAIFKPSIWTLILMMSGFFWVGPVKTVRSIGLQIKEETYIEASKAFGASAWRIIFRHIAPLLIPYSFASMALYVPGAIVYESTISVLGLGDSTIVTWGQILHDALTGGAVLNGQWWWVIPPGLAIALMGMTFAFLGFAMDKILNPRLRTR